MATAKKADKPKPVKSIFALTEDNRKKLPVVAAVESQDMQDVVNTALEEYFKQWEKKHGKIPMK
jgi:hypothetical protein